ncbi:MAG: hypothetical protein LBH60_05350 [Prevotellaceae bacterium]|jgi:hypothetical protein|nr:hypothetical protein [Prevotellaceae bacterium]
MYRRLNHLHKIIKIQDIVTREQCYGVSPIDAYHRYINPVYRISEQTFYNYLACDAKRELAELEAKEQRILHENEKASYDLIVNQNKSYKDAAKTLHITRLQVCKIAKKGDFLYTKQWNAGQRRNADHEQRIKRKINKLRRIAKIQKAANKSKNKYSSVNSLYLKEIKPRFHIAYRTLCRYMEMPIEEQKEALLKEINANVINK